MSWLSSALKFAGDTVVTVADNTLSTVGLRNVIPNSAYSSSTAAKNSNAIIGSVVGIERAGLNAVVPGAGVVANVVDKVASPARAVPVNRTLPSTPSSISPAFSSITQQLQSSPNLLLYIVGGVICLILLLSRK